MKTATEKVYRVELIPEKFGKVVYHQVKFSTVLSIIREWSDHSFIWNGEDCQKEINFSQKTQIKINSL